MTQDDLSFRVLILAPVGRDAVAMVELLELHHHPTRICYGMGDGVAQIARGAGALLLTEEVLEGKEALLLLRCLDQQPPWSEIPVIILTRGGEPRSRGLDDLFAAAAGSVTLLERPLATVTLVRSIEVAMRSRRRQYQVRDLLQSQLTREEALRDREERLRLAVVALQDADRRKDAFLATLSHELRNPLAPIRNAAKILASPRLTPMQLRWAQSVIERQTGHMAWLLDDLLELTRITQGKLKLRKQACSLQSVIDAAVETARPLLERKGHELLINVPPDIPRFVADPVRLAQAISNLLTNAAKYTDAGGRVELSASLGEQLVITVADNGIGIQPEQLGRLFTMFSQVSSAIGRSEGGLGVGLALVRGLLELHEGTIEAHSAGAGRGSSFIIRLPFQPAATLGETLVEAAADTPLHGKLRLLIVDDNHDAADTLAMLLTLEGHDVKTAYDGRTALSLARISRPDVALLDIGMPEFDGYETARAIRQERGGRDVCLVALTGWGQEQDKRRALEAGFDTHLTKPVELGEMRRVLAELVSAAQEKRSNESNE
ncbi:MAG: response regulator [Gammaproteobacteria bacterium]|nr:response regulator [Gammaproteobacteria bacterium]